MNAVPTGTRSPIDCLCGETAALNASGNAAVARVFTARNYPPEIGCASEDFAAEVDSHGSPVSVPAADWLVCFVPGLQKQWWHRFANKRHQHVFAIRMLEDGSWLLVESWWTRILVTVLTLDEALKFLRWGAMGDILQVRESIPGIGNQLRGWANCAAQVTFMLGRAYWTWTPHGLYRRLLAERGVKTIDLTQWLPDRLCAIAARDVEQALEAVHPLEGLTLKSALLALGNAIMRGLMSRSALALYRASISESGQIDAAAHAYSRNGLPRRAVAAVREALQRARLRGEIDLDDPGLAASHFVALFQGDLYQELLFGLRSFPDTAEIRVRVESAIELFLQGTARADSAVSKLIRQQACLDRLQTGDGQPTAACLETVG